MKFQFFIIGRFLIVGLLFFAGGPLNVAAQTNTVPKGKPPTGLYASVAEISPKLTMNFGTNGEYQVEIGPCGPLGCLSQKGKWKWEERQREFLLTPIAPVYLWHFEFRRFRVDKRETDTLEWVSPDGEGNVLGMYKSIRFKRIVP